MPAAAPARRLPGDIAAMAVLAAAYFVTARISLMTAVSHETVTALWIPAGLSLATLLVLGRQLWPGVLVGAIAGYAGMTPDVAVALAAINTLGAWIGASLIKRFASGRNAFRHARDVMAWTAWTGILTSALVATLTVAVLALRHIAPPADYDNLWVERWLGDLSSVLLLAPAMVLWWDRRVIRWSRRRALEAAVFLLAAMVVSGFVFGFPIEIGGGYHAPRAFAFFPILAWAAFRLGTRVTATAVAALAVTAIWATLLGRGPFAESGPAGSLILVQAFLATSAATTFGVAAAVEERQRALAEAQRLRQQAEHDEDRERFLSEASSQLGASLELNHTLDGLARLAVPRLADWCAIHLVEDGGIRQVTLAHVDPERVKQVQELSQKYPPTKDRPPGYQRVIESGEPILIPVIDDAMLRLHARSADQLAFAQSLGLCSNMVVPLIARGRTIGAMSLASTTASCRHFTDADLALAMELGRRVAIAVDNTRLFQQVQEAVRVREDFLAIASHELRTPVAALRLQVQIVERALQDEIARARVVTDPWLVAAGLQRILETTGVLSEDSRRLVRLVNGLLDVTRIATGKLDLHLEEIDLRDVVRSGIESVRPDISQRNTKLVLRAPNPVIGRWDRLRLEQVVANLLSNAVKYGEGRPVIVGVALEGAEATLCVQDHGKGIDQAFQARMFNRFEQGSAGTPGLGLGLYITRQIVESHGGRIEVESGFGKGTTVTVRLPRITPTTGDPARPEPSA